MKKDKKKKTEKDNKRDGKKTKINKNLIFGILIAVAFVVMLALEITFVPKENWEWAWRLFLL